MLDREQKNIGATVSMIHMMHKLTDKDELPIELTKLFMLESDNCNSKVEGCCTFDIDEPDACISPPKCMIGECPLGSIVDKELKFGARPDSLQLYGKDTMNLAAGLTRIGYTGWRKHWHAFKGAAAKYWDDRWMYFKVVLVVLTVYYGSALVGHIHGTYF
jgi:hypothetical protein